MRFSVSIGLRLCGIDDEPFCPGEKFLGFEHFGALQMADLGGQPLDRRGDDAERREKCGVPVALDDLRRDRLDGQAELLGDIRLDARIELANVPTAPEIAQVAISARAATSRSRARENSS